MGSRRPTRYVLVPGPVIIPGLRPSTRPTRSLGVAVLGKSGSIQAMCSHSEVAMLYVFALRELRRGAGPHDASLLEHVMRVGHARERLHVLVDQQNRLPRGLHPFDAPPDLGADERR